MNEAESEHLNPTEEITLETVKERAVRGVVVLTGRTFVLSFISLFATGLLTVFLSPSEFGVFWIVSAVVNFLGYFSDIGLAAALIQKKEKLNESDLKTTFTVQETLVVLLLIILFLVSPFLSRVYGLSPSGRILLYSLGLSFFFSSLKTIPSILLERHLEFGKLIIPQILENLTYNILAVFLAWKGFGVASFTFAVLARGVIGLISMYILKPWMPGFAFSKTSLKRLLSYGIPYQANTLLATIKDDGMTAVLGGILGPTGIGLLGWAQKWGYAPLRFFMDHVVRVTFPAFARMQENKESLERSVTRSVFFISFLVLPSLIGLLVLAPLLVRIIPRYGKWEPALIPLYLISVNTVFASVTTELTNLLNAIGKIKITFKLMVMWAVLTWLFVPALSIKFGVNGASAGYSLVSVSSILAIFIARRYVSFSLLESFFKPAFATLIMGVSIFILRSFLPSTFVSVAVLVVTGVLVYSVSIYLIVGVSIISDVKRSFTTLFSK